MGRKLPKEWIETTLGEIAEWGSGGTPKRSEPSYYGGNIPWIKTGDLNDSTIKEANEYITKLGLDNSSAKIFPKGSIGIAMYGATIGRTAFFAIDAATNQACAVARPFDGVLNYFLHYYLKSEKQNFIDKGKGGAQPNISQTVIKAHPFPLPPLPEQQRIVTKLDQLFAHLEVLKKRLARIPALLSDFRQSVLTQAVTGKLTDSLNKENDVEYSELENFCESSFYGPRFSRDDYDLEGIPTVRTTDMTEYGEIEITSETPRVKVEKYKLERFKVNNNDLLITRTGSIGKMAIYSGEEVVIPSAYLIRFRFKDSMLTKFIYYVLTSPYGQRTMGLNATALTQPNLNAKKIRAIKIPVIPIKDQKEIVNRIESLFAKADQITARYEQLKTKIDTLPQAILAKAFRGELVEQLPGDGSALELLEEIKKAKEELQSRKKKNPGKKRIAKKEKAIITKDHQLPLIMDLVKIIRERFGKKSFTFEELEEFLSHHSKNDYIASKQKIYEMLRNEKLDFQGDKLITKIDQGKGIVCFQLK